LVIVSFPTRTPIDPITAPYAALLLRLTLGVVFIAHALFKVLVLGLPATAAFFANQGFPGWTAYVVFLAELLGGVALAAGLYTRVVAIALLPVLFGAFTVHWPNGWYFGAPHGGWEYIAVLIAALLVQAGLGDGAFSLIALSGRQTRQLVGGLVLAAVVGGGASATSLSSAHEPQLASSAHRQRQDGETLARRYFEEVWNQGKVDVLDELLAPDYINHTPSAGRPPKGPDGLKPIVLAIRRAFPDLHFTIEDVIVTPEAVAIRTTMTGTHEGDLFGIPPTHRKVSVMQLQIERIKNGRIVEHWRVTDELSLMRQLGVVPQP
jgi:steroid delta-isomerase-like uncharacterized protein